MGGKVGENPAALRAAVFSLSSKNLRGGGGVQTPPSRARVNLMTANFELFSPLPYLTTVRLANDPQKGAATTSPCCLVGQPLRPLNTASHSLPFSEFHHHPRLPKQIWILNRRYIYYSKRVDTPR